MSTKQYHHHQDSHLFLIRVWPDKGKDGEVEWNGKLQHVVSGEVHTFQGCPHLIEVLLATLSAESRGGSDRSPPTELDET